MLKGKKPETVKKRLKMLIYGPAGVGKTTSAIQFPKPYLIDTERGAENDEYVDKLTKSGGLYWFSNDMDAIVDETKALMTEKHDYQTVIVDPISVPYNTYCDSEAERLAINSAKAGDPNSDGSEFARNRKKPDRAMRHLFKLLTRLDMNVIVTAHAKALWEGSGKNMRQVGLTFDAYNKLDYLFDLVLEVTKRGVGVRQARVIKTRIAGFPEGDTFDMSYDAIADRYGRKIIEKGAVPVQFATIEQIHKLTTMLLKVEMPQPVVEKWLERAGAETFAEMDSDTIQKCIQYLEDKLKPEEGANKQS